MDAYKSIGWWAGWDARRGPGFSRIAWGMPDIARTPVWDDEKVDRVKGDADE